MDRNIRYVREHRVAALLNDMVVHLVTHKPADPLTALVQYLESHTEDWKPNSIPSPPPATTKGSAAPRTHTTADASSATTTAAAEAKAPAEEETTVEQQQPKHKGLMPSATSNAQKPVSLDSAPRVRLDSRRSLSSRPKPPKDQTESLLRDLIVNEQAFSQVLARALSGEHVMDTRERTMLSEAAACSSNTSALLTQISTNHCVTKVAFDAMASGLSFQDYFAMSGFRLLHEIFSNEQSAAEEFAVDADKLQAKERELLALSAASSSKLCAAVEESLGLQLKLSFAANRGHMSRGAVEYQRLLSEDIHQCLRAASAIEDAFEESNLPRGTIHRGEHDHPEKQPLPNRADVIIREFAQNERAMQRILLDVVASSDPKVVAAAEKAVQQSKTMLATVDCVQSQNLLMYEKQPKTFSRAMLMLQQTTDKSEALLHSVHGTEHSAEAKAVGSIIAGINAKVLRESKQMRFDFGDPKAKTPKFPNVKEAIANLDALSACLDEVSANQKALIAALTC